MTNELINIYFNLNSKRFRKCKKNKNIRYNIKKKQIESFALRKWKKIDDIQFLSFIDTNLWE